MNNVMEMFAPGDQWILPPIPLLDEEFDYDDDIIDSREIPFNPKNDIINH